MKIDKFRLGIILAVVCLGILVSSFFLPWWTIEYKEKSPNVDARTVHDFSFSGIHTVNRFEVLETQHEDRRETAYSDISGSDLDTHFFNLLLAVAVGIILIVLFLISHCLSGRKKILRLVGLILGFAVIFVVLSSAVYFYLYVPYEVGNSHDDLNISLDAELPVIDTMAGSNKTILSQTIKETVWGPSFGWHSTFAICIIMISSIALIESPLGKEGKEED
ncbi:MAG: hypothetical protein ACE5QW_08995 [Thermoplasmata archaeon]